MAQYLKLCNIKLFINLCALSYRLKMANSNDNKIWYIYLLSLLYTIYIQIYIHTNNLWIIGGYLTNNRWRKKMNIFRGNEFIVFFFIFIFMFTSYYVNDLDKLQMINFFSENDHAFSVTNYSLIYQKSFFSLSKSKYFNLLVNVPTFSLDILKISSPPRNISRIVYIKKWVWSSRKKVSRINCRTTDKHCFDC